MIAPTAKGSEKRPPTTPCPTPPPPIRIPYDPGAWGPPQPPPSPLQPTNQGGGSRVNSWPQEQSRRGSGTPRPPAWPVGPGGAGGQRRHRLDAGGHRPGHDHAARAGPLLRRPRPPQERPLDDHAQLLRAGDRQRRLGPRRLQPRLRARRQRDGPDRQPRLRRVHGRRPHAEHGLRRDHPVRPVRRLPADVRGDHPGAHHRRLRRAEALRLLRPLHRPLVDPRLLADRPLGLGDRRLAVQARRPRLRRRHRRPRLVRPVGPDRRHPHRPARRQRRADGAARRADDRPRRRPPVVRLVRLQRRLRPHRRRPRGQRVHRHQHGGRRGDPHLGRRELPPPTARSASSGPPAAPSPASSRSPRHRAS